MTEKEKRFRILNKTNKTVTVKIGPETHTMSWDEYNQNFVTVDKFWCVFNEEMKKKSEDIEDLLGFITVYVLEMHAAESNGNSSKQLEAALKVGTLMEKLQKVSGFTNIQIMQLVRQRLMVMNPFMVNPMFPMNEAQKRLRRKNQAEIHKEQESRPVPVCEENKPTIGDAFPGLANLKEKLESE